MKEKYIRRSFFKKSLFATLGFLLFPNRSGAINRNNDIFKPQQTGPLNETLNTISNLHTTHGNFLNKDIPDEQIQIIKESCIRAANSFNMQTYSIVEVSDKNLMNQLCGYQGSYLLLFSVDYNRLIFCANYLGTSYYPNNMTNYTTACINASIAAQTATIAARSLGIDSLLTNGIHRGDMERLWKLLNLPEKYCFPLIALVLGYADQEHGPMVGRLTGKSIFHKEKYHTFTQEELKEIVDQYDDPSLNMGLNPGWKDSGYDHYLKWLHEVRLQANINPTINDTPIFAMLKKRGFVEKQGS